MKKIFLLFIILIVVGCEKKKEIILPLNPKEIEEALSYGKQNKDLSFLEFTKDWSIDLGYEEGKGRMTILTPFLRIALLGQKAAKLHQKVDYKLVKLALEEEIGIIHFIGQVYGDTPTFGRKVKIYLKTNGKEIQPYYLYVSPYAEIARDYYNIAKTEVKFRKSDIPSTAKEITVVVKFFFEETNVETSCEFKFNLNSYR